MNRRYQGAFLLVLVLLIAAGTMSMAKNSSPKPKPRNAQLGSIGTTQLPGAWCSFGKAYTLGRANALNVTIKSAEYTLRHVKVGDQVFTLDEGKKFLVVHCSLHNPLHKERNVSSGNIDWTVVDAKDQNIQQEYQGVGVEGGGELSQTMKPAQKVECIVLFRVPAQGEMPKLMAASHDDKNMPVARYDLRRDQTEHPRNKVAPLPPPYADPGDSTGASVAKHIVGVIGTTYTTGGLAEQVDKVEFVTAPLREEGLDKNNVYVVISVSSTYSGGGYATPSSMADGMLLKDSDGATYQAMYGYQMPISATRKFDLTMYKGDSCKFRQAFMVPKGVALQNLKLQDHNGYPIMIDLSAYKTP